MAHKPISAQKRPAWLGPVVLTVLVSGGVCAAALAACAAVLAQGGLSAGMSVPFSLFSLCLGCFSGGYLAARLRRSGGLLCGLICSAAYIGLLACAGLLCAEQTLTAATLLRSGLLLLAGCAGGVLGVHRAEKSSRRRRAS